MAAKGFTSHIPCAGPEDRPFPELDKELSGEPLYRMLFDAVLLQDPEKLRGFFQKDAVIDWPCTNERFSLEEYIRVNCSYPGRWGGELLSILPAGDQTVLISRVWPEDRSASFHCVSVIRQKRNRIVSMTEYWSDDGHAPEWRQNMGLGKPIEDTI